LSAAARAIANTAAAANSVVADTALGHVRASAGRAILRAGNANTGITVAATRSIIADTALGHVLANAHTAGISLAFTKASAACAWHVCLHFTNVLVANTGPAGTRCAIHHAFAHARRQPKLAVA